MANFDPEEQATALALDNPASFHAGAMAQERCVVCGVSRFGRPMRFEAHHVVTEQECRRSGAPLHHHDDALLVCTGVGGKGGCHYRHHKRTRVIKTTELKDQNVRFAARWLKGRATSYLRRHYDDNDRDPRLERLDEEFAAQDA